VMSVPIWEPACICNINIELVSKDGIYCIPPPNDKNTYQPKQMYKSMPVDLNCVSIQYISIKYVKNNSKNTYYVRHNFIPEYAKENHELKCKLAKVAGVIPNVCYTVSPLEDNVIKEVVWEPNPNKMEVQDYYIKTCMMIDNEDTLTRGVEKVDWQTKFSKVGIVHDENDSAIKYEIDHYVSVPFDHVLSWELQCNDYWRKKNGYFAYEDHENACFIVDNVSWERLKHGHFKECWKNIDKRPLSSLQFELLDVQGRRCTDASIQIQIGVTFIAYPAQKPYPLFKITLHPTFYRYEKYLQEKIEKERYKKMDKEYEQRLESLKLKKI
jgi:hypothetical protein